MNKKVWIGIMAMLPATLMAQNRMTPELLWKLGRVAGETVSLDGKSVIYGVTFYDLEKNKGERNLFSIDANGGQAKQLTSSVGGESVVRLTKDGKIVYLYKSQLWEMNADGSSPKQLTNYKGGLNNVRLSPDGQYILFSKEVKLVKVLSTDRHADLPKSNAMVYDDLNYRHWDAWEDGSFQHIFYANYADGKISNEKDLMPGEAYDCPQMPFGGVEDAIWSPDSKQIFYVSKKKFGKAYAQSTNTDIYQYTLADGSTKNISEGLMGYDVAPSFNASGSQIAWLSMAEDGYEADKNDLMIRDLKTGITHNITKDWDESVASFKWSNDGKKIYYLAATNGTEQLFEVSLQSKLTATNAKHIKQITKGQFDVSGLVGESNGAMIAARNDMNHAAELYRIDLKSGAMTQLTQVNNATYSTLAMGKIEERHTKTSDGLDMLSWVAYPPDFDPAKKYPTLLYCQGGPQSALTQFYSFRWNLQLMAANGYIVIAPNRRGMQGHGVKWNRDISGDWGGQPIRDYLAAIDDISNEPYVDKSRRAAVGASYGGYSVYMLAGVHENRFKTFIAHDGLFDLKSWYGTTEELWFANKDIGGPYWASNPPKSYSTFNPSNYIAKWNTPILVVQGGIDYRVPIEQGLQAYQAAQLKGIKSRLLYLPEENHWVLQCQNAQVWQREFFTWLKETL